MKVTIYVTPDMANSRALGEQVKSVVETHTGKQCIVKFIGDPTRPVQIKHEGR